MKTLLKKLKDLRARLTKGEEKIKRVRIKGMGMVVLNEDGTHADVGRWK